MVEITLSGGVAVEGDYVTFTVELSEAAVDSVSMNYRTLLAGTADSSDLGYYATSSQNNGVLTFAPGQTTGSISIYTDSESLDERDEAFTLELSNLSTNAAFAGGESVVRATGVILDNDGTGSNLALFVSDPVLVEGDGGVKYAVFEVRLSEPAPAGFTASYTTIDGSALAGEDYQATSGSLTFATDQQVAYVSVAVIGDTIGEAAEQFSLAVTPPASVSIGTDGAVGEATILDTDTSATLPEISISGGSEVEGGAVRFTVTLSEAAVDAVEMNYRTLLAGTANSSDLNYYATSSQNNGVLTFAPGQTTATITISTDSESLDERDEAFTLELSNVSTNAVFAGGEPVVRATGVILDNDGTGSNLALFVSDPVLVEGDSGVKYAVFEVRLSEPAPADFTAPSARRRSSTPTHPRACRRSPYPAAARSKADTFALP